MAENQNKWNGENPWLGLGAYSEGQRLYGRDKETSALTEIILNHTAVVVYGKSGIGKSSLLKAGVFPLLRQNGFIPIYLRLAHNTDVPYTQQIENSIVENVVLQDLLSPNVPDLGLWDFLHRNHFSDQEGNPVTLVIVFDQFEEIFTLTHVSHKSEVQSLFSELADVLNDVKPDKVIQAENNYGSKITEDTSRTKASGFILQTVSKSALKYEKAPSFRIILSLRDDSLYLLERNTAKIPALKVNRYNLCALDEESAMEVIMKPCPGLFTAKQGKEILNGLAYYEYDDYRVVDPAIISLFLFSYYKGQGQVAYNDIFERYYQDCTKNISDSSLAYIEDHLLTERGNRNQIPYEDLIAAGISDNEMDLLLKSKVLKTEKRKNIDYVEFSHDRLCEQALKHREERKLREQTQKMRKRMLAFGLVALFLIGIMAVFFWQNRQRHLSDEKRLLTEMENDSIQRLNQSLHNQIRLNSLQKDSIILLNDSLNNQLYIIKTQKDSLTFFLNKTNQLNNSLNQQIQLTNYKNDTLNRYLTIYKSFNNVLHRQLVIIEQKNDSLNEIIKISKAQEKYIEESENKIVSLELINENLIAINSCYKACIDLRRAIESGNFSLLSSANQSLKSCNAKYFRGIKRTDKDELPLEGHFIFNTEFVDKVLSGSSLGNFFEEEFSDRSIINNNKESIYLKNCCIAAKDKALYSFRSRGRTELAVVTEPSGLITIRIHDKTNNKWYNDTKDVLKGQSYKTFTIDLPRDKICSIEIEITNTTDKDISFVIISN